MNPWLVTCGTGHRDLRTGDPAWRAEQLPKACAWLRDVAGTRYGISGLARGFDMDWAEALLDAGLKLWVAIPFEEQAAKWTRADRARWTKLREAASRERIVGSISDGVPPNRRGAVVNKLLFDRNRLMLDRAGAVLTDWEPGRLDGGTAAALLDAAGRGMPGVHLDPINRAVNFQLPAVADLRAVALFREECGHVALVATRDQVAVRMLELATAGFGGWQMRRARPRETWQVGCDVCIEQLAMTASAPSSVVSAV